MIVDGLRNNARGGIVAVDYVSRSRMADDGVWGTDVEISVAATLMRTPIAVYSEIGCGQHLWQVFEPLPTVSEEESVEAAAGVALGHACMIYLKNTNHHFEPVVDM